MRYITCFWSNYIHVIVREQRAQLLLRLGDIIERLFNYENTVRVNALPLRSKAND